VGKCYNTMFRNHLKNGMCKGHNVFTHFKDSRPLADQWGCHTNAGQSEQTPFIYFLDTTTYETNLSTACRLFILSGSANVKKPYVFIGKEKSGDLGFNLDNRGHLGKGGTIFWVGYNIGQFMA